MAPIVVAGTVVITDKIKRNGLLAPTTGACTRHALDTSREWSLAWRRDPKLAFLVTLTDHCSWGVCVGGDPSTVNLVEPSDGPLQLVLCGYDTAQGEDNLCFCLVFIFRATGEARPC